MYDLHAHILPGVDDGAQTEDDTLKMARVAADSGTKVILATPHRRDVTQRSSVDYVRGLLDRMNGKIAELGIDLSLRQGMENHLDLDLPDEVSSGRAIGINGSRYMLVEMPFFGRPNYIEEVMFQLQVMGVTPVLAHPERIEAFQRDVKLLETFVERGMLSQVTAGSITGHFGKRVRRFTHTLLRTGLVHVIASDTHFATGPRSPTLLPGVEEATRVLPAERVQAMVVDTPQAILNDLPVDVPPPQGQARSRRRWQFWRRVG
ncbi:MAG: tyrosine protein phosphatase [Chloroflexi bacterium]|nr:tyrosine protein phosphatase [Chloroflexota bacterium]